MIHICSCLKFKHRSIVSESLLHCVHYIIRNCMTVILELSEDCPESQSPSLTTSLFTAAFTGLKSETHSLVKVKSVVLSSPETRLLSTKHILPSVMKRLLSVCLLPGKHLQLMYHWKIAFDVHSAVVRLKLDFISAKNQCAYPDSVGWWQMLAIAVSHF